ncbi:phospholipase [Acinetobacter sp. LoGeW2-3]|uniref:DUF4184 family protein n=1 Tax=Acinetobacter sp. LoGeW2-3 TaxID=1808001 RepID=UPI000C05845D|nr:DUF4184 family protein [Acinetobacter sp. LoGeW2-3]ATO19576.1 phospholipase [Acinetobacter sp. LoGeW2-3]
MPFTLSHAVLAPPLSKLTGHRLPVAALAIGCMVPDLYRLFTQASSNITHLWSSIIHPNLWIGLGFCLLWYAIYRPVVYRFVGIQHELDIHNVVSAIKFICATCIALILGIATHLIWDGLTHADFRTFAFRDFLAQPVAILGYYFPMHRMLQLGTSALALPFIGWMIWCYYHTYQQYLPVNKKVRTFAWGLLSITFVMGMLSVWDYSRHIPTEIWQSDLYYFTGRAINEFSQWALLVFTLGCILFLFLDRQHRMG